MTSLKAKSLVQVTFSESTVQYLITFQPRTLQYGTSFFVIRETAQRSKLVVNSESE